MIILLKLKRILTSDFQKKKKAYIKTDINKIVNNIFPYQFPLPFFLFLFSLFFKKVIKSVQTPQLFSVPFPVPRVHTSAACALLLHPSVCVCAGSAHPPTSAARASRARVAASAPHTHTHTPAWRRRGWPHHRDTGG